MSIRHLAILRRLIVPVLLGVSVCSIAQAADQRVAANSADPLGELSLAQAATLTLAQNPGLAVFAAEIRAHEGAVAQASMRPNPILGMAADDLGAATSDAADQRTFTLQVAQPIELGGKRAARREVAEHSGIVTKREADMERARVLATVAERFASVLAAQERLKLADELLALGEKTQHSVGEKVKVGKVFPIEATKANIALTSIRIQREQAVRELTAARCRLATLWGSDAPRFSIAVGDHENLPPLPAYESLESRFHVGPATQRWTALMDTRQAELALANADTVPDITVSAGVKRYEGDDSATYLLGVSMPLPIFDRNQGGHAQALARVEQTNDEQRAYQLEALAALQSAYQGLAATRIEIELLKSEMLPGAHEVFRVAVEAYKAGKFGLLDMLDAQRTLFDARSQYLQALANFHTRVAEIERLVGGPLDPAKPMVKE